MPQDFTKANLNAIATPTPTITLSKAVVPNVFPLPSDDANLKKNYNGINWAQFNQYQKPSKVLKKSKLYLLV